MSINKKIVVLMSAIIALSSISINAFAAKVKSSYRLTPLDVLNIKVFQEPDLDTVYKITADGTVVLPLIGEVSVSGLSITDAQNKIKELYEKDYLVHASVSIFVAEYAPRRVYVTGQVFRPGEVLFPPEEDLTLSRAIANAGGTTRIAKVSAVFVKRKLPNGTVKVYEVDLGAILNDKNVTDFPLKDGDTIDVKESAF